MRSRRMGARAPPDGRDKVGCENNPAKNAEPKRRGEGNGVWTLRSEHQGRSLAGELSRFVRGKATLVRERSLGSPPRTAPRIDMIRRRKLPRMDDRA